MATGSHFNCARFDRFQHFWAFKFNGQMILLFFSPVYFVTNHILKSY